MLILFDFDGTLADSATDLANAANHTRLLQGLEPLPLAQLKPGVSRGAAGLLQIALNLTPEHPDFATQRQIFLDHYHQHVTDHIQLFPGISTLLQEIENHGHCWGVMTNKHECFAWPILEHLQLKQRASACVAGDTIGFAKPNPAPLFYAAGLAHCKPQHSIYVGDDQRDIQAGQAAGMKTIAVAYGYGSNPHEWGADAIASTPSDLWPLIQQLYP